MYGIGDIVLLNGQMTRFFEVIHIEENIVWVSDGNVQTRRVDNNLQLICKAENRQDKKVPLLKYWKG